MFKHAYREIRYYNVTVLFTWIDKSQRLLVYKYITPART